MKVLQSRLSLGDDLLKCVGSTYKFECDDRTLMGGL